MTLKLTFRLGGPAGLVIAIAIAIATCATPSAHAQDAAAPPAAARITLAASGGSLGIGPEVGFRPLPVLGVRASASVLGLGHDVDVGDINYHGDLKLRSFGAAVDLYPFESAFRLSAGLRRSRNRIDLVATPREAVTVGQTVYTPEQIGTIEGRVRARKWAPTFTLGVAKNRTRGLAWSLDAGVMLHGRPRTYDIAATGELASNPLFQDDLAREQGEIEDKVDDYKVYPIVQVSIGYAF